MPPRSKAVVPSSQLVYIPTEAGDGSPRSKAQQEFNRLSRRIARLEGEVAAFREAATGLRRRVQQEYRPLQAAHNDLRAGLVRVLDNAFDHYRLSKTERAKVAFLIGEACADLPAKGHPDLQPVIDKHNPPLGEADAQAADAEEAALLRAFFEQQYGLEFDEAADLRTPGQVQAYVQKKLAEEQAAYEAAQQARAARRAQRKKTPRQQAADQHKQAEQTGITQAVRTLYLDLVKHLHPDREPDPAERLRKTELLKRVTTAYEAGELMTLLRLQLDLNRIDQAHLAALADEQLRYYNRLLREQAQELAVVLAGEQQQLAAFTGMPVYYTSTPAAMAADFERQQKQLQTKLSQLTADLTRYAQDPAALRAFLKEVKLPRQAPGPGERRP